MALNMLQGTVLRAYGYTKDAMYIAIVANILNILGMLFLYMVFGLPVLGIAGVAASSAFHSLQRVSSSLYGFGKKGCPLSIEKMEGCISFYVSSCFKCWGADSRRKSFL